jgi:glycerol-3-phosphate cytidylyltransferase-like family protein
MKNIRTHQLKKCIFVDAEEFEAIIQAIFDDIEGIKVDYTFEGLDIYGDEEGVETDKLYERLGEYFDVEITSIHIDDCDYIGVWVVYKEGN